VLRSQPVCDLGVLHPSGLQLLRKTFQVTATKTAITPPTMPRPIPLTRQAALNSWRDFLPKVPAYARERNQVQPGHENVSSLGASIRFRTLLEDEIIRDTLARHSFESAEKWLQEVCWRRYWKGWLEMRPQVWTQWRGQVEVLHKSLPSKLMERIEAVSAGQSGVACMDKIARELIETGYLHNHARMWWASFWIHVEGLPWELGADFFFRHLLDADPASNTLSWRWVAGLQTPGKTYLVRLSNIQKYAPDYLRGNEAGNERLDDGVVTSRAVHPCSELIREPLTEYPTNIDQKCERTGLWLHPDDLTPESGPLRHLAPQSVAAHISDYVYSNTYRLSAQRIASLHAVVGDGLDRAGAHFGCPAVAVDAEAPVEGLSVWALEHKLSEVVAFAPTVGPIRDMLPRLERRLQAEGVHLRLVRRPSDASLFTNATAGFFPFWQKTGRELKSR